ncbi:MAG: hypothetical protein ACREJB_02395 [Planctomycetaceae bacterium]
MTLEDLNRALVDALGAGKIGTPVHLRVHVELPEGDAEPGGIVEAVMVLARTAFAAEAATVTARRDDARTQWNLLFGHAGGQSALVTINRGCSAIPRVRLLVVGNHGVVRLEGGELFAGFAATQPLRPAWVSRIDESIAGGNTVPL